MREQKDTRHEGGSNTKYHGYSHEVVPCDKRQNNIQEKWSREIPTYLALAGFDKEKGKEASCVVLNSPYLLQTTHKKLFFNWANINFVLSLSSLSYFGLQDPAAILTGSKALRRSAVNRYVSRTATIIRTERQQVGHSGRNESFENPRPCFPRCAFENGNC